MLGTYVVHRRQYDVVIEASGAETCVQMSCMLAKVGGKQVDRKPKGSQS
jgi:hypothetical protein